VRESFVSEPIQPIFPATGEDQDGDSAEPFAAGEPLLPRRFLWRGDEHVIADVLERWKGLSHAGATMAEEYLRRHWYRIRTAAGHEMKIYFERQARSKGSAKQRWWIFSIISPE
jgi:hypothetical protein